MPMEEEVFITTKIREKKKRDRKQVKGDNQK